VWQRPACNHFESFGFCELSLGGVETCSYKQIMVSQLVLLGESVVNWAYPFQSV